MFTPIKQGEDSRKNWRSINEVGRRLDALSLPNQERDGAIAGQRGRQRDFSGSNPFRIYQASTWLKFKVTDGYVITTAETISVTNIETELTITAGVARYWFYVEMTATTAEVKTSASTLAWSALLIPLGWVDTLTGEAETTSTIYQFHRDHIFNPCAT